MGQIKNIKLHIVTDIKMMKKMTMMLLIFVLLLQSTTPFMTGPGCCGGKPDNFEDFPNITSSPCKWNERECHDGSCLPQNECCSTGTCNSHCCDCTAPCLGRETSTNGKQCVEKMFDGRPSEWSSSDKEIKAFDGYWTVE